MSKKYTVATIGAGAIAQGLHLPGYNKREDVDRIVIADPIPERIEEAKRAGYGTDAKKNTSNISGLYPGEAERPTQTGGDGSAAEFIFNERYTLQPKAWYQQNSGQ